MSLKDNSRPTFGSTSITAAAVPSENNEKREEIGAIWKKTSKNNTEMLNIKFNIPKKVLQELLANATSDKVDVSFVAFPNKNQNGDQKRPSFRIYENQRK